MAKQDRIGTHATSVNTFNGLTVVRYHDTDILRFSDDAIILDSGGWRTATTKLRMNQASSQFGLGIHVYQSKGKWYVNYTTTLDFTDGMVINRKA